MTIDLKQYQDPMPYPTIFRLRQDQEITRRIMSGYSGAASELSTVLQYAQHSLRCKNYSEVSETMRGIFYVETLHMELLGDVLCKLGGNAEYIMSVQEKNIYWQASMVNYSSAPSSMLRLDIEGEKGAVAFYEQTAKMTDQPELKSLMLRLAEDERLHVKILSDLYSRYFRR